MNVAGKVVAVTGATHGIGREIARVLCREGAAVAVSGRNAEQGEALREDVTRSYQRLQRIVGDVEADGRPCLCRVFRPPTLAMSRTGLEAVLDCGFTVSLSGSYTAQDYEADDARSLFTALRRNTRDGAVLILHMSDSCAYTAEALDLYLTYMEKYAPEYRFRRVTDAL